MRKLSLDGQAREHLERAAAVSIGRDSETMDGWHEHALRRTVLTPTAGTSLGKHESPGEATPL
jgi:hypothetical protein